MYSFNIAAQKLVASVVFLIVVISSAGFAQVQAPVDSLQAQNEARMWAEVRKPYFKVTKNDSLFVINNGDAPFAYSTYYRGELAGFMESMFFNANVNDVIGPLFIDGYAMLFKVAAFDSTYKMRASQIYIKPEGKNSKDSLNAVKKANKYLQQVKKGADFAQLATKYSEDETSKTGGDLGWFNEGTMVKEIENAVMQAKKGDIFVVRSPYGAHVIKVTEDKIQEDRGKIKVIPLVKKI
jgi:parvulin-like peptidyl-prolyl isomerase